MIKKNLYILLPVIIFCLFSLQGTPSMAQMRKVSRIEKKADKNFARQKFDKAMGQYETAISREGNEDSKAALHLKTARLYFMVRNYTLSAEHYGKAMDMLNRNLSVDDVCNYVDALRFIGEDKKAESICLDNAYKDIYSKYQRYQNTLDALAMKHDLVADPGYIATRLNLNTPNSEYWVGVYGNQPFYAMSYSNFNDPGKLFFHRSYYYELHEKAEPGEFEPQKSPKFSDYFRRIPIDLQNGPVSFSPDMKVMMATVVEYDKSSTSVQAADRANRPFRTKLYYSLLKDDKRRYSKYRPVFPQESEVSYAHPYLINDGKTLLFTSDMPGGYGGFDLYICHYDETAGNWGDPINLGPELNTEGDEIFPVLFEDRLIFASNGLPGYGGYDLFSVFFDKDGVIPGSVNHFPYPVNSVFNDYYMAPVDNKRAYFTSDREALGRDDIYYLRIVEDLSGQHAKPNFGLSDEAAIKGGQMILKGMAEAPRATESVSLKNFAPEGLLLTLYFDFDSSELTSESVRRLQQFLVEMDSYKFDQLYFDGYADETGSDAYNFTLSEKRASKVAGYLRDHGVSADFVIQGKGRIKLTPQEIEQEIGRFTWSEEGIDWVHVNRRARRVEIYNQRINKK